VNTSSSAEPPVPADDDISERTKARKRKIPPPHQLVFVRRLPACRIPRNWSAEELAPPKLAASPPPFPA
jgi:hypothetical protein